MTIFETVKAAVTPKMAAEQYGFTVPHNGMICCPFHEDHHPSLKLNDDYYFCFGCNSSGDVIDFTAKLFGLTPLEAAQKLSQDFGLRSKKPSVLSELNRQKTQVEQERLCVQLLTEYLCLLWKWKIQYEPKSPEEPVDDRYAEACQMIDSIEHYLELLRADDQELRRHMVYALTKNNQMARLQDHIRRRKEEADA